MNLKNKEKTMIDRSSLVNAIIEVNKASVDNFSLYNELLYIFEQLIDLEIKKDKYISSMSAKLSMDAKNLFINVK